LGRQNGHRLPEALAGPRRLFRRVGVELSFQRRRRAPSPFGEDTVEVEQADVQPIVDGDTARLSP
jgi:hypothetical protein